MNETAKGVLAFLILCFILCFVPYLFISWGSLTIEGLLMFYFITIFIGLTLVVLYGMFIFIKTLIVDLISNPSYHICYHDYQSGPQHYYISRQGYQFALTQVKAPYVLAYIWVMARKYGDFKNLELKIGSEYAYVWCRYNFYHHLFYKKNGKYMHYTRQGSFRFGNNDKQYRPTYFKVPFIESESQLLDILQQIDPNIKTMKDVIDY